MRACDEGLNEIDIDSRLEIEGLTDRDLEDFAQETDADEIVPDNSWHRPQKEDV